MTARIGIPYAEASVDDQGNYYVTCPVCGDTFGSDSQAEDEATKDPVALYGAHYQMRHDQ